MSTQSQPLSPELLVKIDAYWRASNYLSVGQRVDASIFARSVTP